MKIISDKIYISGPKLDGTWRISFDVGEYMTKEVQELMNLTGKVIELEINESKK